MTSCDSSSKLDDVLAHCRSLATCAMSHPRRSSSSLPSASSLCCTSSALLPSSTVHRSFYPRSPHGICQHSWISMLDCHVGRRRGIWLSILMTLARTVTLAQHTSGCTVLRRARLLVAVSYSSIFGMCRQVHMSGHRIPLHPSALDTLCHERAITLRAPPPSLSHCGIFLMVATPLALLRLPVLAEVPDPFS